MKVLHVLQDINGTTIPVEIATAIADLPDMTVKVVSRDPLPEELPDTVRDGLVLEQYSPIENYGRLLDASENRFDAIHTHKLEPAAKLGYRAKDTSVTHINTQHGHIHYTLEERLKNLPGLLFADAIVYNSETTARSYNPVEKIFKFRAEEFVVHNGVNTERINGYEASVGSVDTIVTAARLVPRKNLGALLRSLIHIDTVRLKIIGDGPERSSLEKLARRLGVAKRVEFVGYLPKREDVYREMAAADVFLLPSHGEGFGVSVAEAMAIGLPVIVSDLPIFYEVVGETGRFVDRESPEQIAAEIATLVNNPDTAQRIGQQNRERIFESFTLAKCAQGYRDVYRSLLGGRN